jgi:hypothetical protein
MRSADSILKRDPYENCVVKSQHGDVMFYCSRKRANWYLKRKLAEILKEDPLEIRLTFETKGLGNADDPFYLQKRINQCVVCGSVESGLTRHHVIPYCFRRYFPPEIKDHSYHDILPLCTTHHDAYEQRANELKVQLEAEYDAPIHGLWLFDKSYYNDLSRCVAHARTLLKHGDKIPLDKQAKMIARIKEVLKQDEIDLNVVATIDYKVDVEPQGKLIVERLTNVEEFIHRWRAHFIESMQPKFMPKHWSIVRNRR